MAASVLSEGWSWLFPLLAGSNCLSSLTFGSVPVNSKGFISLDETSSSDLGFTQVSKASLSHPFSDSVKGPNLRRVGTRLGRCVVFVTELPSFHSPIGSVGRGWTVSSTPMCKRLRQSCMAIAFSTLLCRRHGYSDIAYKWSCSRQSTGLS